MLDDDLFASPPYYKTLKVTCQCPFVNYSSDLNCEYETFQSNYPLIASRNIQAEEELTIHYGVHHSETSLINGIQCRCQATNCVQILQFNF